MNIYKSWGFQGNPFQSSSLEPTERGRQLLVGRDDESEKLKRLLFNSPKLVTIEGANGVGKTSLVNVVSFDLYDGYIRKNLDELFIPCRCNFQVSEDPDKLNVEKFVYSVFLEVAQTLVEQAEAVKKYKSELPNTKQISSWLNAPQLTSFQATLLNIGLGTNSEQNTASGFEQSGLRKAVLQWLEQLFPIEQGGGVVCVLDNLELLQTTAAARQLLERLRDELLTIRGLRWVLCGATGITHTVVSSPRLDGFLHSPLEIKGVTKSHAHQVLRSRVIAFTRDRETPYLPFVEADFELLYGILNRNLRNTLSKIDNYCTWVSELKAQPNSGIEKQDAFALWLNKESSEVLHALEGQLGSRAWEVFHQAVGLGGVFSPADFQKFDCNSPQALRPQVKDLELVQLVVSVSDESDQRRKTIQITPKGFLVAYARAKKFGRQFELPL